MSISEMAEVSKIVLVEDRAVPELPMQLPMRHLQNQTLIGLLYALVDSTLKRLKRK